MMVAERTPCLTGQQIVILTYRAENKPVAEIARLRGLSAAAVYKSIARGAETLRAIQTECAAADVDMPADLHRLLLAAIN